MVDVGFATLGVIPSVRGLRAELDRQTSTFDSAGRAGGRRFGDAVATGAGSRLKTSLKAALAPAAGILAGLGGVRIFGDMIAEAQEAAKVSKITSALIKTTGGAANLSASQVGALATSLSKYAAVDDELIQSGANVLLTFRNLRNEAGKGNDVFTRATKASLDLSTVLGGDMKSSALQLGKALQDPVKGITALGRAGVQFSESQKAQIMAFIASNDLLSAQKLILGEVEHQVGGAAGANATAIDRLNVSFKNLEEAAGTAAAPALNKFADLAANDVIPAVEGVGGVVGDAARTFGELPAPIRAATGALVAFRVAQGAGLTGAAGGGLSAMSSGLDSVRLRAMEVGDEFRRLRAGQVEVIGNSGKFTPAVGRMSASLLALKAGAVSAGAGLKRGLSGAMNLVGGPWGIALAAGTVALTHFWGEHQKAKQKIEDFTEAIKADSGAIGDNTRQLAVNTLEKEGLLKAASRLGISLQTVTDAALGNASALSEIQAIGQQVQTMVAGLNAGMGAAGGNMTQASDDAAKLVNGLSDTNGALADSISSYKRQAEAAGNSAATQGALTTSTETYATKIKAAKTALQGLLDVENKRADANAGAFRDQTRLAEAFDAAKKEAADGAKTLDKTTEAGQKNRNALSDLADAWNGSADKVKNAKGAYEDMRKKFIDVATGMGATKTEAKKLADDLLGVPKNVAPKFSTPGMKKALADVKRLHDELAALHDFAVQRIIVTTQAGHVRSDLADIRGHAGGGLLRGPGTGTSDSFLIRASNGEFMQRKAAVDYYGADFMNALNNLRIPRFASGGQIGSSTTITHGPGVQVDSLVLQPANFDAFLRELDRRRRLTSIGGVPQ
jgi:hypothetical protein